MSWLVLIAEVRVLQKNHAIMQPMAKFEIPNCFYRISIKALVLNESRDKFLIVQEENGDWELPGGGLDWGCTPQEDLSREIQEEMGIKVSKVAYYPSYFLTGQTRNKSVWLANLLYETELENLNFTASDECIAVRFVNKNDISTLPVFPNVAMLAEQFDPARHQL